MELWHHLIDTDHLGARITHTADEAMPPSLTNEERARRHDAVDEAVRGILETELGELMDRVEGTAKHAADPERFPAPPTKGKGFFEHLGHDRLVILALQEMEEQNTGESRDTDSIGTTAQTFLAEMPSLAPALEAAVEANPLPLSIYHQAMDHLEETAREAGAAVSAKDRWHGLEILNRGNEPGE